MKNRRLEITVNEEHNNFINDVRTVAIEKSELLTYLKYVGEIATQTEWDEMCDKDDLIGNIFFCSKRIYKYFENLGIEQKYFENLIYPIYAFSSKTKFIATQIDFAVNYDLQFLQGALQTLYNSLTVLKLFKETKVLNKDYFEDPLDQIALIFILVEEYFTSEEQFVETFWWLNQPNKQTQTIVEVKRKIFDNYIIINEKIKNLETIVLDALYKGSKNREKRNG